MEYFGVYKLKSFVIESSAGEVKNWGNNLSGLLIYTLNGYMSVSINKELEIDPTQTDSENLLDSILFYSGTYAVEGNIICHQVTQASSPFRIGKEMIRYADWKGNELHLTTPPESFGKATLVWVKM
jgi:hypothetical protein